MHVKSDLPYGGNNTESSILTNPGHDAKYTKEVGERFEFLIVGMISELLRSPL